MGSKCGQSLIEACLAIMFICLMLFGLLQIAQIFAASEILDYAAARAARAKVVGFNDFMVGKCARVALIPNSGMNLVPGNVYERTDLRNWVLNDRPGVVWSNALASDPISPLWADEKEHIPYYLGAEDLAQARGELDYAGWRNTNDIVVSFPSFLGPDDPMIHVEITQNYRLWVPMHHTFYDADDVTLAGECSMAKHFALYLDDQP